MFGATFPNRQLRDGTIGVPRIVKKYGNAVESHESQYEFWRAWSSGVVYYSLLATVFAQ